MHDQELGRAESLTPPANRGCQSIKAVRQLTLPDPIPPRKEVMEKMVIILVILIPPP